jgi:hypothetical protein
MRVAFLQHHRLGDSSPQATGRSQDSQAHPCKEGTADEENVSKHDQTELLETDIEYTS